MLECRYFFKNVFTSAPLPSDTIIYAFLCVSILLDQSSSSIHYNVICALCLKLSVFSSRSKYIPRLACPRLISADSEERLHTYQAPNRQCPGVTSVHVQYMCRRLCAENSFYSSTQSLGQQHRLSFILCRLQFTAVSRKETLILKEVQVVNNSL